MSTGTAPARSPLLRWGLPRDPAASSHLAGFLVATMTTVILTRGLLAATGFPQLGGGALHVAHVLWGGLLMALSLVVLLSFAGPVARPLGAVVGGVGFGLFIDEIGKFVTADNDYFYEPTAFLVYLVVVVLLLLAEALHGRRPHHPVEYLAGAADQAVAGLAGGFTPRARAQAQELLAAAGDVRGAAEVGAVLRAVDDDAAEVPNIIDIVSAAVVRATARIVTARWVPLATVAVLVLITLGGVVRGLGAWIAGTDAAWWVVAGLLSGALASTGTAVAGLVVVRADRLRGYLLFRRAVVISLLVTQVFVFRLDEWSAVFGLLLDLAVLGLVTAELDQIHQAQARARRVRGEARAGESSSAVV
ncbi:hypothetical protein [Actinotalea sp.]|uniref:hypothetical protein n=1 Tax=Actinotalea sp. TaxID=1872145 RepID=UPI002C4D3F88|nr:hypothetical protein [Actinotalea sp.]HQY33290.1 hypothetical protein [Actinotalea sp.]HRA50645.1 hypothetical protein [Actinotalea sp.]